MSKIPRYAHYYMSEEEIEKIHREEIWESYKKKGFKGLLLYEIDWFRKYFPEHFNEEMRKQNVS